MSPRSEEPQPLAATSDIEREPGPESAAVDATPGAWRSRARVRVLLLMAYLAMLPSNPSHRVKCRTAQLGLVANPIIALMLCGSPAAGVVIPVTAVILVCSPLIRSVLCPALPSRWGLIRLNWRPARRSLVRGGSSAGFSGCADNFAGTLSSLLDGRGDRPIPGNV